MRGIPEFSSINFYTLPSNIDLSHADVDAGVSRGFYCFVLVLLKVWQRKCNKSNGCRRRGGKSAVIICTLENYNFAKTPGISSHFTYLR